MHYQYLLAYLLHHSNNRFWYCSLDCYSFSACLWQFCSSSLCIYVWVYSILAAYLRQVSKSWFCLYILCWKVVWGWDIWKVTYWIYGVWKAFQAGWLLELLPTEGIGVLYWGLCWCWLKLICRLIGWLK